MKKRQEVFAQRDIAHANAKHNRTTPLYSTGDWVLLYEPPVTYQTSQRPWSVPKKFQDCLTGPHRIESGRVNAKNEIRVFNMRKGLSEWVSISRIVPYNPWSDDFLDTAEGSAVPGHDLRQQKSQDAAAEVLAGVDESGDSEFRNGDEIRMKEFVVVSVEAEDTPFLVGTVCELGTKQDAVRYDDGQSYRTLNIRVWVTPTITLCKYIDQDGSARIEVGIDRTLAPSQNNTHTSHKPRTI